MKTKLMSLVAKIMSSAVTLVLVTAVANANSTCLFLSYQPDVPEELAD